MLLIEVERDIYSIYYLSAIYRFHYWLTLQAYVCQFCFRAFRASETHKPDWSLTRMTLQTLQLKGLTDIFEGKTKTIASIISVFCFKTQCICNVSVAKKDQFPLDSKYDSSIIVGEA